MYHIIDDEAMLREILVSIISDMGYQSLSFESGDKYLEYMNSPQFKEPTAILSDVTMPGISGYDLVLKVRKKYPFQKIALITGNPDDTKHPLATQQLCYTLQKPYHSGKLEALLQSLNTCNHARENKDNVEYVKRCEFGIDDHCPFYKNQHLDHSSEQKAPL